MIKGSTNVFRVFVSSTFGDFQAEREVLQRIVFPKLVVACKKHDASFLGVDLRWGISPERARHNQTMQTCLEEIERCRRLSPKPNFLILIGDRYGWLPPPERIPGTLFLRIIEAWEKNCRDIAKLAMEWYEEDKNASTSVWLLKPRHDVEDSDWSSIVKKLQAGFAAAADAIDLDEKERLLLTASATHQEIHEGFIAHASECADHVFAWRRRISDLANLDEKTRKLFTDGQTETVEDVSRSLKTMLGSRFVEKQAVAADLDCKDGKSSAYLKEFAQKIFQALWSKIKQQINETPARDEEAIHREFAKIRSEGFVGRGDELKKIADYLARHDPSPHLISAPGGMGKTSLLAKCVADMSEPCWIVRFAGASSSIGDPQTLLDSLWPSKNQVAETCHKAAQSPQAARDLVDQLLVGYTQRPEDFLSLLGKDELTASDRTDWERKLVDMAGRRKRQLIANMTAGFMERRETCLIKYLEIIRNLRGGKVVVVIDALDQLPGSPDLAYLIGRLGKIAGDRTGLPGGVWLIATQRDEQASGLSGLSQNDWNQLIELRLQQAGRRMQPSQRQWLASGFGESGGNPLALKLAMERSLRLASREQPPTGPFSIGGLIRDLFDRLDDSRQHGLLGERALAYLASARQGLPEEALLDALAGDEKIRQWFVEQVKITGQAWSLDDGLPPVLWSRLHMDLEPYLVHRDVFGTSALHFFHREFHEQTNDYAEKLVRAAELAFNLVRVACRRLGIEDSFHLDRLLPDLYQKQPDGWALGELPWLLELAGKATNSRQLLEAPAFVMAKVGIPGGIESLAADYSRHAESPWAAFFQCHYAALLLNEDPRQFLIQRASELAPGSTPRRAVEEWLKQVDIVWIRNAVVHPNPRYEIELGKSAPRFETLDNGQIACWPSWKGDDLSRTIRILEPDRITGPVHFLENPWQNSGGIVQKGHVEKIVGLPGTDWLVTRHTVGPLLVWQGERNIAKLIDEIPVVSIFASDDRVLIAVYEDGLVGRWHLPADLASSGMNFPRELRTDAPEFRILAEEDPEQCKSLDEEALERRLVNSHRQGDNLTLVFTHVDLPPRIVILSGQSCRQFYGRSPYAQNDSPDQFLPTSEGCYVSSDGFKSILYLTEKGDAQLNFELEEGDLIAGIHRDNKVGGVVLVLEKDYPKHSSPWALARFQSDGKLIWRRKGLLHQKLLAFEEAGIFFYQTDDGVVCLRLSDHSEQVCDLPQIPKGVTILDRNILFVWDESSFYQIDLATGQTVPCPTGRGIADVYPQAKDILATHADGHLRSWSLQCLASQENGAPTAIADVGCIAALDEERILVCSDNSMVMWQASSDGKWQDATVWHALSKRECDIVNCMTVLADGKVITWGNQFIRIWQTTPSWQLLQTLSTGGPVRSVLKIDDDRYFYEFGKGPDSWRGNKIWRLRRSGEIWMSEPVAIPSKDDWKYHSFLTPVMSDGSTLLLTESENPADRAKYSLLLSSHSSPFLLDQDDKQLHDWFSVHRTEIERARQQVIAELREWAHGVHFGEQEESLSRWAGWVGKETLDLLGRMSPGSLLKRSYPPTLELALRENAMLRDASLSNIAIYYSQHGPDQSLVRYQSSGKYHLWVNRVRCTASCS